MRYLTLLIAILFTQPLQLTAQTFDLFGFSGYTFGHRFDISGGRARISDGHTYGGSLSYIVNELYAFELLYSRQNGRASARSVTSGIDVDEEVSVNYILAGSKRMHKISEKARVFGGLKLGVVIFDPVKDSFDPITRFAAGISGGIKYFLTDKAGIRLQSGLNFPITNIGASLWWSSGGGTSVGVSSYTPIVQFSFTGGVFYRISK